MRNATLCFLVREKEICLAMKKRDFGEGKWNGVGGKVEKGETIEEAAVREIEEEICSKVKIKDLRKVGDLKLAYTDKPDWDQHMHIFFIEKWSDEPKETEEMKPKWFPKDNLPYEKMWVDDPYWLPRVISKEVITGQFTFSSDGTEIIDYQIN